MALLAPLACDHQHIATRRLGQAQPQRLGEAQPAAVEQRQDRDIALLLPNARRHLAGRVDRGAGVVDGERLRHALRQFWRAQRRQTRRHRQLAPLEKPHKPAQHRQPARDRRALQAGAGPPRQIGAEIGRGKARHAGQARHLAAMLAEEIEKRREVAAIRGDGMRRGPALRLKPIEPGANRAAQIRRHREARQRQGFGECGERLSGGCLRRCQRTGLSHNPIDSPTMRARNPSSSLPIPG
jgi:hypothetical protein